MQCINNIFLDLTLDGYTYIVIPKKAKSRFFATKEIMVNNTFRDDTIFDEFKLTTKEEKEAFKQLNKCVFYKIWE